MQSFPELEITSCLGKLTLNKIKQAFIILKSLCRENRTEDKAVVEKSFDNGDDGYSKLNKQVRDLKSLLTERDNEISILVSMVKKGQTVDDVAEAERSRSGGGRVFGEQPRSNRKPEALSKEGDEKLYPERQMDPSRSLKQRENKIIQRHLFGIPPPDDKSLFDDPAACFEWFRERHELHASIEQNKTILRDKYNEAKLMGERANQSRSTINYLKNSIESIRRERAIQGALSSDIGAADEKDMEEEETYRRAIEQEKHVYKESFDKLRTLKPEIEHIKMLLEKGRATLQQHFDQWFNSLYSRRGVIISSAVDESKSVIKNRTMEVGNSDAETLQSPAESKKLTLRSSFSSKAETDEVNEDILAFYQAKEELMRRRAK